MPLPEQKRATLRRRETAARYGISLWLVDRLVHDGILKATKAGKVVLIDLEHADRTLRGDA
jgi:hypothetical protein